MRSIRFRNVVRGRGLMCGFALASALFIGPVLVDAQKPGGAAGNPDEPVYTSYRGVRIGSTVSEARKALGDPADKSDVQDVYIFNENEIATIYFDSEKKVSAISVDFMSNNNKQPTPVQVVGAAVEAKPDGSVYKVMSYPKEGFKVIYNRTAGQSPMVSVTIQKMQ